MEIDELYNDKEAEKLRKYIDGYYSEKVPPPQKPTKDDLSFWKLAGFEAISFAIPAMAMAVFSAIRTGGFFFILEKKLLSHYELPEGLIWLFSIIVMLTALLGFEGYALSRGIKRGREQMEIIESKAGTIFTFIIITMVGVFTGLELIENMSDGIRLIIDIVMAIITGLGGGIITFFGGNDIGVAIRKFDIERIKLHKNFQDQYNEWRESAVSSYISSKSKLAKASNQEKSKLHESNRVVEQEKPITKERDWRKASVTFSRDDYLFLANMNRQEMENVAREHGFDVKTSENWKKNAQRWLMINYIENNKAFPQPETISLFGMNAKDAARFIISNREKLLNSGFISQEIITMAEETLKKEN